MSRSRASDLRMDMIGLNAIHSNSAERADPYEIRLRAAARFADETDAKCLVREVESLYLNGPAGGCGITFCVRANITILPALIARELANTTVRIEEVE